MTICTGALGGWLDDRDELPDTPLLAMVPVSVRTDDERGSFGNRISTMIVPLPTDEPDPVVRRRRVHEAMRLAKQRHRVTPLGADRAAASVAVGTARRRGANRGTS